MWRSKKSIIVVALAVVVAAGSIGGIVLAADNGGDDGAGPVGYGAVLDRVCQIYGEDTGTSIDPDALRDAFAQARREMRDEALERRLQHMIEQGKITQAQADEYLEWWQARPDVAAGFGWRIRGRFRGMAGALGRSGLTAPTE